MRKINLVMRHLSLFRNLSEKSVVVFALYEMNYENVVLSPAKA